MTVDWINKTDAIITTLQIQCHIRKLKPKLGILIIAHLTGKHDQLHFKIVEVAVDQQEPHGCVNLQHTGSPQSQSVSE